MKFLKKSQINFRNVKDNSIAIQINGEVTLDTTYSVLLPKGTTAQRPASPAEGHMRYNTSTNELEVYQGSTATWKRVAFKEPSLITQQTVGTGNDLETKFGPLNSGFTNGSGAYTDYTAPVSAQNIIVLVENVMQLATTNYVLEQNPSSGPGAPYTAGWYVVFDQPVPTGKPVTVLHGFDR